MILYSCPLFDNGLGLNQLVLIYCSTCYFWDIQYFTVKVVHWMDKLNRIPRWRQINKKSVKPELKFIFIHLCICLEYFSLVFASEALTRINSWGEYWIFQADLKDWMLADILNWHLLFKNNSKMCVYNCTICFFFVLLLVQDSDAKFRFLLHTMSNVFIHYIVVVFLASLHRRREMDNAFHLLFL